MSKTKLAVTTVNSSYAAGSGAIGVAVDSGSSIGVDGNKATALTGDPRIYSYADGKVLYYGSLYTAGRAVKPDLWVYDVASSGATTTWTKGSPINQTTTWPNSINGHGAVGYNGFLYVISRDEATVIKADPNDGYKVKATYDFNTQVGRPNVTQHAGAAITEIDGKIYALFVSAQNFWGSYDPSTGVDGAGYANSTLVRLDDGLGSPSLCSTIGKNAFTLELNPADGKLYVACIGGSQRYGQGANPDSRLDAVDISAATMTSTTKMVEADLSMGDFRGVAFTQDYAYLMVGTFRSDYTTFDSYILQFYSNDFSFDGWTYGALEVPVSQGSLFTIAANENNHVWLVRGTYVDLYADGDPDAGEGLAYIDSKFSTNINTVGNALFLNGATLLMESGTTRAARGYVAPAFASHSVQAATARKVFTEKAEKLQNLRDKAKAKKKK